MKYGKVRNTPRHTYCYGTPSAMGNPAEVSYLGSKYMTEAIPGWLTPLKAKVLYTNIIANQFTNFV